MKENRKGQALVTESILLGYLAMNAVRQSPYTCPDNLKTVLEKLKEICKTEFKEGVPSLPMKWFVCRKDLISWIKENLSTIPELCAWNERKNGNKAPFGFCDRYSRPSRDDDFIDLDALFGNTAYGVWSECVED